MEKVESIYEVIKMINRNIEELNFVKNSDTDKNKNMARELAMFHLDIILKMLKSFNTDKVCIEESEYCDYKIARDLFLELHDKNILPKPFYDEYIEKKSLINKSISQRKQI